MGVTGAMKNRGRLHLVMSSLLYPAVLGTLIYAAFQKFDERPAFFISAQGVLAFALLLHYVLDYVYTVVHERGSSYSLPKFLADFLIVICMFLATQEVLGVRSNPSPLAPVWWMCLTKVFALLWEFGELGLKQWARPKRWSPLKRLAIGTDMAFAAFYVALGLRFGARQPLLLAVVVLLDAGGYAVHDHYAKKLRAASPAPISA
jgi:hypothetical protein